MTTPSSPTPEDLEELQRRISAMEIEMFALVEQLRRVGDTTERTAGCLDELEDVLTEVSLATAENTDALQAALIAAEVGVAPPAGLAVDIAEAMQRRQTELETGPPPADSGSPTTSGPAGGSKTAEIPLPDLDTLHDWVDTHLAPMVRRTTTTGEGGGVRWCQRWWEHRDAVERFTALFLTHGQLSVSGEPTWLSVYLRDHLDPHLATLTSPYGPFYACSPRKHSQAIEPLGHLELDVYASMPAPAHAVVAGEPARGPAQHSGGTP